MNRLLKIFGFLIAFATLAGTCGPCAARESQLAEFLAKAPAAEIVPGADHYGPVESNPPLAKAYAGDKLVGYAFVNADWVDSTGYSGQPIQILVGLTPQGKISGARLMAHHEPIVLVGIPPERIAAFIRGYVGRDVLSLSHAAATERPTVDIVSGATVTVTVIAESMVRSAATRRAHGRHRRRGAAPGRALRAKSIRRMRRLPNGSVLSTKARSVVSVFRSAT